MNCKRTLKLTRKAKKQTTKVNLYVVLECIFGWLVEMYVPRWFLSSDAYDDNDKNLRNQIYGSTDVSRNKCKCVRRNAQLYILYFIQASVWRQVFSIRCVRVRAKRSFCFTPNPKFHFQVKWKKAETEENFGRKISQTAPRLLSLWIYIWGESCCCCSSLAKWTLREYVCMCVWTKRGILHVNNMQNGLNFESHWHTLTILSQKRWMRKTFSGKSKLIKFFLFYVARGFSQVAVFFLSLNRCVWLKFVLSLFTLYFEHLKWMLPIPSTYISIYVCMHREKYTI